MEEHQKNAVMIQIPRSNPVMIQIPSRNWKVSIRLNQKKKTSRLNKKEIGEIGHQIQIKQATLCLKVAN
jgi:hypothetical protein